MTLKDSFLYKAALINKSIDFFAIDYRNKRKIFFVIVALISFFYLVVALHTPLSVMSWQAYDDMLFINNAQSLAEGRWLGKFSELTLVKGPGYSFFLAFNYWLGLPITLTHGLFYCLSLFVASLLVFNLSKSILLALFVYIITLWDPRVFELNRVLRDAIYSGQTILVIVSFYYVLFIERKERSYNLLPLFVGVLVGWFWLTREEGVWIIPGLFFLIVCAITTRKSISEKYIIIKRIIIIFIAFFLALQMFNLLNKIAYGDFVGVDLKEANFQSAYKSMESVRVGEQIPFVSVPRKVRTQLYEVSPTLSKLKKHIDPENSVSVWEAGGCTFRPTSCGDISNGFFYFALREAASKEGYYSSPKKASEFFELIHKEIKSACSEKRLVCETNYVPYMPPISFEQFMRIPASIEDMITSTFSAGTFYESTPWKILGPENTFNRAISVLNYPVHYPMDGKLSYVELSGWYHRKGQGDDWFQMKTDDDYNLDLPSMVTRVASPDLVKTFNDKNATSQRFKIYTRCSKGCKFTFLALDGSNLVLSLKQPQQYISNGDITMAFDFINIENNSLETNNARFEFSSEIRLFLHKIYGFILPTLIPVGLLFFILSCYLSLRTSKSSGLLIITISLWLSIIARVVILALVDISSFPAVIVSYMQPIFTLSIIASILSIGSLFHFLQFKRLKI